MATTDQHRQSDRVSNHKAKVMVRIALAVAEDVAANGQSAPATAVPTVAASTRATASIIPTDLRVDRGTIECLAFSGDGSLLATGSDKSVRLWDTTTGQVKHDLKDMPSSVQDVAFSSDGRLVAAAGKD